MDRSLHRIAIGDVVSVEERIDRFWEWQNISGKDWTVTVHFLEAEDRVEKYTIMSSY